MKVKSLKKLEFFDDVLSFPRWGSGAWWVWLRNFLYFKYTIGAAVSWIFIEPLLFIFAFGYGLGSYITEINGLRYAQFIAPAILSTTAMFVSFFEGTYGTYTKLARQNTFQSILLTPVMPDEIVIGEIAWATSKALLSSTAVGVVVVSFNLISIRFLIEAFVVILLLCWCFAGLGVYLAARATSYATFTYLTSGFITPMSLFCGTYFPLERLPLFIQFLAQALPLTHALAALRMLQAGPISPQFLIHCFYLFTLGIIFMNLAASKMKQKLIN